VSGIGGFIMKKLLTNHEMYNGILKENGIDAIIYGGDKIILDCNGNNINIEEIENEELLADIMARVEKDEGIEKYITK
jgi:hypothetical protein